VNEKELVDNTLLIEIKHLIQTAKQRATIAVNAELTLLYWQVGKRIADNVLNGERANYGKQIIDNLAQQLTRDYGKGWSQKQLHHCLRFAEVFPDAEIVSALRRQLSWSHFRVLLPLKQPLQREFYAQMCCIEAWSVRTLSERIDSMLFERTALSKKPELLIKEELDAAMVDSFGTIAMNLFTDIDQLKTQLDNLRPLPANTVRTLHEQQVLEWTYHSNAIEGNTLTLKETKVVLEGITIGGKSLREHFEFMRRGFLPVIIPVETRLNYYDALDTAHTRGNYAPFITLVADLEMTTLKNYLSVILGEDK
jgi:hypothetical protein